MSHCFIKLKFHKTQPSKNQMWYNKAVAVIITQSQFLEVKFCITAVLGILGSTACNCQNKSKEYFA